MTLPWTRWDTLSWFVLVDPLAFDSHDVRRASEAGIAGANAQGILPVISNERLSGNPHSGGYDRKVIAERLAEVFPEARILIVIREQIDVIASVYKQYLIEGGALGLSRYLIPTMNGVARVPCFTFDFFEYDRLLELYQGLFGCDRVIVLAYEELALDPDAFVHRIRSFVGLPGFTEMTREASNISPSAIALQIKRYLNGPFVRDRLNPRGLIDDPRFNEALLRSVTRLDEFVPGSLRRASNRRLRDAVSRHVGQRYAEGNRRLRELCGLDLEALGYTVGESSSLASESGVAGAS